MENLEIFLDYIGEDGYVYRYNYDSKKYYNTGISLKGSNGNPGRPGKDGKTPHIGPNGHWFIGDIDTGYAATGSGGGSQVQSDWNQTDTTADDFIKNKPTIPAVPTISTDIDTDGNDDTKTASPKAVKTFVEGKGYLTQHQDISGKEDVTTIVAPVNETDATLPITTLACDVGKYYRIDVAVDTLGVTLPAMTDLTTVRTVVIYLTADTTPAITISSTAVSGGTAPDVYKQAGFKIEAGKTYEINALWNGAAWIVGCIEIDVPVVEEEEEGGE